MAKNKESIVNNELIGNYLGGICNLLNDVSEQDIRKVVDLLKEAYESDRQVLMLGNGGSAATASHLVCDLQKGIGGFYKKRFRVLALTDSIPVITAWANDVEYAEIFARQVAVLVNPGDLVIGFSGSGNSPNVIRAIETGNQKGAVTIGFAGNSGGKLAEAALHSVIVESNNMQQIEDVHLVLGHLVFTCLMQELE